MGLSKEDLDRFVAAEREALRAGLPEKLVAMQALWRDGGAASLATLERMAHSLYGSAGTFGMNDTSAACKQLEKAVHAFAQAPSQDNRLTAEAAFVLLRDRIGCAAD